MCGDGHGGPRDAELHLHLRSVPHNPLQRCDWGSRLLGPPAQAWQGCPVPLELPLHVRPRARGRACVSRGRPLVSGKIGCEWLVLPVLSFWRLTVWLPQTECDTDPSAEMQAEDSKPRVYSKPRATAWHGNAGMVMLACRFHARITHVKRGGRWHCHVSSTASDEQAGCVRNQRKCTRHHGK